MTEWTVVRPPQPKGGLSGIIREAELVSWLAMAQGGVSVAAGLLLGRWVLRAVPGSVVASTCRAGL